MSGTEDAALGDRWDVISKWREGAIFGFAKHCVYTDAQHPLLCRSYVVMVVFHLKIYKIDQCLSREARTTKTGFTVSLLSISFPRLFGIRFCDLA